MKTPLQIFTVDSFTSIPFRGNPAGVCIHKESLSNELMQSIAMELGLSETAFVTPGENGIYGIRFFSPQKEIALCGHATLASAKILAQKTGNTIIEFRNGEGLLLRTALQENGITLQFPVYQLEPVAYSPAMQTALGVKKITGSFYSAVNKIILLETDDAGALANLQPDFVQLKASHSGINGVLVTAPGRKPYDYEYRYFWPWAGTNEDPVTGGVQTFLAKYWADKLNKTVLQAFQSSERTGTMTVEVTNEHIFITGQAVVITEGHLVNY